MFRNCTSLTTSPKIYVDTINQTQSFERMFDGCTSLTQITLSATTVDQNSMVDWVSGVASSGTFYKPSTLTMTTGVNGIPNGWTVADL